MEVGKLGSLCDLLAKQKRLFKKDGYTIILSIYWKFGALNIGVNLWRGSGPSGSLSLKLCHPKANLNVLLDDIVIHTKIFFNSCIMQNIGPDNSTNQSIST